jgi:hypothetical protein
MLKSVPPGRLRPGSALRVAAGAGALALAAAAPASAHTSVRVHIGVPQPYYTDYPYYPPVVQVQPRYVAVPVYREYRQVYVDPRWDDRRAWRYHHRHHRDWRHYHHHHRHSWGY